MHADSEPPVYYQYYKINVLKIYHQHTLRYLEIQVYGGGYIKKYFLYMQVHFKEHLSVTTFMH